MFCPKCGRSLPDEAAFCAGCGANLSAVRAAAAVPSPAVVPSAARKKGAKRKLWPIILAAVLVLAAVGGFIAYRQLVVKPREATDNMIRCLKKSDAYESAEDFRDRVDEEDYDYYDALTTDYGKQELADYFDKLFRDENYAEYVHDASVLLRCGYLNGYDYTLDQYIKDSALQKLWEMGSPISPDDVYRVTDDSYADDQSGVYFRGVRIEDYDNVSDHKMFVDHDDAERYCGIVTGRVYGSIFVWPVSGWENGYIVIDSDNSSYFFVQGGYSDPTGD